MKKTILYIVPLMLLTLGMVSCSSDDIDSKSVITTDSYEQNDFDKWLEENFRNPYNIDFKYRYEEIESDLNYYTVPAEYWQAVKLAHLVKYLGERRFFLLVLTFWTRYLTERTMRTTILLVV